MTDIDMTGVVPHADWKGVSRTGGIALLLTGILWFSGTALFGVGDLFFPPGTASAAVEALPRQKALFQTQVVLYTLGAFTLLFGTPVFYHVLKERGRTRALIASILFGADAIVVMMEIVAYHATGETGSLYSAAGTDALRAAYLAATALAIEVTYGLEALSTLVLGSAVLVASVPSLQGSFGKAAGYLGIVAGILLLTRYTPGIPFSGHGNVSGLIVTFVWLLFVGFKVLRWGYAAESMPR